MPNPWISLWLSAANSWAGAARGFWSAELQRQQTALLNEMTRRTIELWSGAWISPGTRRQPGTRRN